MTAHARHTDPETSHLAAASVRPGTVKKLREDILWYLKKFGASTDQQMFAYLKYVPQGATGLDSISPSSLRTRRSELVRMGKVVAHPTHRGTTAAGRACTIWMLAPEQRLFEVE
jgi:hypothetical protein